MSINVTNGLDYLLSCFKGQLYLWPRTIATKATESRQVVVNSRDEALARYEQADLQDCRISAYPYWRPTLTSNYVAIKNAIAATVAMIDLDACNFDNDENELRHTLRQALYRIRTDYSYKPAVIDSGRGYHIIVLLQVPVLENVKEFSHIGEVSTKFIRFVESYLSNNKSDHSHNSTVSLNNCMLRVPGSINSKNVSTVELVKKCTSKPVSISLLIGSFCAYLEAEKIEESKRYSNYHKTTDISGSSYPWIEKLLQIPLPDYRKKCMFRILAPYLINVRKYSFEQSFQLMHDWLDKCSKVCRLGYNGKLKIKYELNNAIKSGYYPISISKLFAEEKDLSELLQRHEVFNGQKI